MFASCGFWRAWLGSRTHNMLGQSLGVHHAALTGCRAWVDIEVVLEENAEYVIALDGIDSSVDLIAVVGVGEASQHR